MYKFGRTSKERLATIHPDLQKVLYRVLNHMDIGIIEGVRSLETQKKYVADGKSKTLNSKHLKQDDGYSHAVDVGVYVNGKLTWDPRYYYFLGGIVKTICDEEHMPDLRFGMDWDGDLDFSDQTFDDLVHFELASRP